MEYDENIPQRPVISASFTMLDASRGMKDGFEQARRSLEVA
jgi:hypothetical protein